MIYLYKERNRSREIQNAIIFQQAIFSPRFNMNLSTVGQGTVLFLLVKKDGKGPLLHPYLIRLIKVYCIRLLTQVSNAHMNGKVAIDTAIDTPGNTFIHLIHNEFVMGICWFLMHSSTSSIYSLTGKISCHYSSV